MRREPTRKREREDNGDEQDIESSTPPPARKRKRHADAEYPSPPSDSGKYHIVERVGIRIIIYTGISTSNKNAGYMYKLLL